MERFPNFPQTIDPVESETILEQFLELNNNVQKINQGYNELAPQVDTNTTDIEELKTQVSESGTRVKVNGQLVAEWSPDVLSSDVATNAEDIEQIRLAQSSDSLAIVGLQSDNITNKQNISTLQSNVSDLQGDVSELNQTMSRTLKTPMSAPTTRQLVIIDSANSQVLIPLLDLFPIGTIIENTENINPGSYIGGRWEEFGQGQVIIGANSTYPIGTSGGSATHQHGLNGTGGAQIVISGDNAIYGNIEPNVLSYDPKTAKISGSYSGGTYQNAYSSQLVGNTNVSSNIMPYCTAYRFRRIG